MDSSDNWIAEGLIEENRRKNVPGLHPGLNDLIRVLAKQAHCVSRTLILCEPHIPTRVRKTKFHKHCSPSKKNKSDSGLSSKAALWTPIRPQNYYYDCFNYTNYPERETDYQDIELKYNAMKDKPLQYAPPKCDEKRIRRSLESPDLKHKKYTDQMTDSHPQKTKKPVLRVEDLEFSTTTLYPKLLTSSEEMRQKDQPIVQVFSSQETQETVTTDGSAGESSDESNIKVKFQSDSTESSDDSRSKIKRKPTGWVGPGGGLKTPESVPCSELLDLQNLIRKSDRENFERMHQMLMLMKELSAKDFCRATCDQTLDKTGYGKGNVTPSGEHLSEKSQISAAKSGTTPQSSEGKLNQYASRDRFTDSSTSSVQSSSGKNLSSERSKSSNKVLESSSESSLEQHHIPYLHDTEEETTSSDVEDRPTTSESSFGKPGIGPVSLGSGGKIRSEQNVATTRSGASQNTKGTDSSRSFKSEHSGGQMKATDSSPSMKSQHSSAKSSDSVRDRPKQSNHENVQNNVILTVCDSPMTVHELVEVSNIITDILVLETVKRLIKIGKYCPPSWREGASSPSMISASTSGPPFEVMKEALPKPLKADSSVREYSDTKSVSLPSPSLLESYKAPSVEPELMKDEGEPKFEAMKSEIPGAESLRSIGSKKSGDEKPGMGSMKSMGEISKAETIKSKIGGDVSGVGSLISEGSRKEGVDKPGMGSMKSIGEIPKAETIKSKIGGDVSGVGSLKSEGSKKEAVDKLGTGSMKSIGEIDKAETIKSNLGGDVSGVGALKSEGSKKDGVDKPGIGSMKSIGEIPKAETIKSKIGGDVSGVGSLKSERSKKEGVDKPGMGSMKSMGEISKEETIKSRIGGDVSGVGSMKSMGEMSKVEYKKSKTGGDVSGSMRSVRSKKDGDDNSGIGSLKSVGGTSKPESMKTGSGVGSLREGLRRSGDDKSGMVSMKSIGGTSKAGSVNSKTGDDSPGPRVGSRRSVGATSQAESANFKNVEEIAGTASLKSVGATSKAESTRSNKEDNVSGAGPLKQKLDKDILGAIGALKSVEAASKAESSRSNAAGMGSLRSIGETSKTETMKSKMSSGTSGVGSLRSVGEKSKPESISSKKPDDVSRISSLRSAGESSKVESMKSKVAVDSTCRLSSVNSSLSKESGMGSVSSNGHRRRSSCPKHSKSPLVEGSIKQVGESSSASQASAEKKRILDATSTSSPKFQEDRRERLSGEATKLSTIDSVCEREDSLVCVNYETDCTVVYYVRITENAYPPVKESYSAPGFMLRSAYDYTIPPRGQVNVKTDLVLELPPGSYGRIAARKCLAVNFGIDVGADIIDRDYRENVTVLLFNHSDHHFPIRKGNKVAQLICESIHQAEAKEKCDLLNAD